MVRRRTAMLAVVALGLVVTACSAGADGTATKWHPVAVASQVPSHRQQIGVAPNTLPLPSRSPIAPGKPGSSTQVPQIAPVTPPTPAPDDATPDSPGDVSNAAQRGQHGPYGTITTTGSKAVALTFDDGPGPYTSQVLDLLEKYHIHATFCLIGRQVAGYAAVVRRMVADGHTICNHTWSHDERLSTRSVAAIRQDLERTSQAIHAVAPDAKIEYFRNPGGAFSSTTVSVANSLGMASIFWNVDPRDWARPGTQAIINNVRNHTHPGSIVLMHDGGGNRVQSVAALGVLLPDLKARFTLIALPTT